MQTSKVIYNGNILIDLTGDTVTSDTMINGVTAHNKSGDPIVGTVVINKYYTGSSTPSASLGNNGDLYLKV